MIEPENGTHLDSTSSTYIDLIKKKYSENFNFKGKEIFAGNRFVLDILDYSK